MILGIERIEPGEGEVTAARRLLERIYRQQKRGFCDIIVVDALYAKAPFINAVLRMHKDVVVKVKQENREIIRDAEGLFKQRMPDLQNETFTIREEDEKGKDICYEVEIYIDEENFTSWDGVEQPLRVLRVKETLIKPDRSKEEKPVYYLVTTMPKSSIRAEVIWRINHRRWDIESSSFNDLKQNWNFEHCFSHDTKAMVAMWTLMIIAFNLLLLFLYRNQRSFNPAKKPMTHVAFEIMLGLVTAEVSLLEDPGG